MRRASYGPPRITALSYTNSIEIRNEVKYKYMPTATDANKDIMNGNIVKQNKKIQVDKFLK